MPAFVKVSLSAKLAAASLTLPSVETEPVMASAGSVAFEAASAPVTVKEKVPFRPSAPVVVFLARPLPEPSRSDGSTSVGLSSVAA